MDELRKIMGLDSNYKVIYKFYNRKVINICEMNEAANTIENWLDSFIDKRISNGFTEGLNNKIKVIKRVEFRYKDFGLFRYRLLYILSNKNMKKLKKHKK